MMRKLISFLLTLCLILSLGVISFAESDPTALKPGDIIELGTYEQDNVTGNGPEPIEWQILAVDGDEAFLVSLHSLDGKKFNETRKVQLSWPESDIRAWLNGDFMGSAFTEDETAALVTVNTEPDSETKDLVFLLSEEELKQYFPKEEERICEPTEYAYVQQGKRDIMIEFRSSLSFSESAPVIHDFTPADYPKTYFLRTVAPTLQYVYSVTNTGYRNPTERDTELCFVRPAIKINIPKALTIMGKLNSQYIQTTVTDPDEIDFLRDMASGINKRLLATESVKSEDDFSKLVSYELDAISKYESVTFPDADFDRFAHDYIDACQLQQKALENSANKSVFEPLWDSGRILRAELISEGYEKYGLDIREEDYLSYKDTLSSDGGTSGGTGNGPSYEFLEGYWSSNNGMHTFEMKKNHSYITTVPVVPHCGDTYELVDGVIRSYYASNPSQKTDNLKITVVSDKEIEVYSYQTKATYTLYKRR